MNSHERSTCYNVYEQIFLAFSIIGARFATLKTSPRPVRLELGNKTCMAKVSTEGCADIFDFKDAIKTKFAPLLDSFASAQLTLFQPDGTTEIGPGEKIAKLNELDIGPWTPLVVTVQEFPTPAPSLVVPVKEFFTPAPCGSSRKQLGYKGMGRLTGC